MEFAWDLCAIYVRAKIASETYLAKVMPTIHVQVNCGLGVDKLSYYDFLLGFFFADVRLFGKLFYWMGLIKSFRP